MSLDKWWLRWGCDEHVSLNFTLSFLYSGGGDTTVATSLCFLSPFLKLRAGDEMEDAG